MDRRGCKTDSAFGRLDGQRFLDAGREGAFAGKERRVGKTLARIEDKNQGRSDASGPVMRPYGTLEDKAKAKASQRFGHPDIRRSDVDESG
jgi:hypothetical protein